MSEEVRDAAATIPKTMLSVYLINMLLMFPAIITVCYHIPDLDAALNDPTTYPAIYVLRESMSVGWMTIMLVIIVLINVALNIVYLAAVTCDLFAFARDKVSGHEDFFHKPSLTSLALLGCALLSLAQQDRRQTPDSCQRYAAFLWHCDTSRTHLHWE